MAREKYHSVSIPQSLIKDIDSIIKKKVKGYSSRSELIKDGVRQLLKGIKK